MPIPSSVLELALYRETETQDDRHELWTVIVLASILLISIAALVVVFARNEKTMGSIRIEAEKAVLIAQMESAVQIQAEQAGLLAGQLMTEPDNPGQMDGTTMDHDMVMAEPGTSMIGMEGSGETSMSEPDNPGQMDDTTMDEDMVMAEPGTSTMAMEGSGASSPNDPMITAATQSFHQATLGLRQLISISEQTVLDDAVAAHAAFGASIAEFEAQSQNGSAAMSFYHSDTQSIEADLRTSLLGLKENTSSRLGSAIEESRSTQFQRGIAVPLILLAGLLAAFSLIRTVATRRRLKALESHIKDKNGFIAAVSHELRTPLTAIVGFAELLQESRHALAPGEEAELIGSIAEQGREVTAIVEDLLVAARADLGQLTIHSSALDLRAEAAQVLETLRPDIVNLELGETESSQIVGDPVRIRQIVRNLVTNATRHGSGDTLIELGRPSDHGYLRVLSGGAPIPVEDRERIFEPYQRAHHEPTKPGFIGLGLAVSRRLARLMDGDLNHS